LIHTVGYEDSIKNIGDEKIRQIFDYKTIIKDFVTKTSNSLKSLLHLPYNPLDAAENSKPMFTSSYYDLKLFRMLLIQEMLQKQRLRDVIV
jgi:hypothetical protein